MADDRSAATSDPDLVGRLWDAHPDGLWVLDDQGITTYANANLARMLGRELSEMPGLPATACMDEQGQRDFGRHLAQMVATGKGRDNLESYFVRPDGASVWGLVSIAPVLDDDGNRLGWLHRVTPYTDRKQRVDTITEREQQLATAQRIARIGSWEWDVVADEVMWSDELCRIFGVPPGSGGTYASYLELIHPEDRPATDHTVLGGAETGVDDYDFDHRVLRPDGEVRWVHGRGVIERGPDGTVLAMSGTVQDISDLRKAADLADEATRRLYLLEQMATAANRATSLREAILLAGYGVPEHTSWAAICAYFYDGTEPELVDLGGAGAADPDPALAERARVAAEVLVGRPSRNAETHSLVAMPVTVQDEVACVVLLLADEVPPDDNAFWLMDQIVTQLSAVGDRAHSAAQLAEARDDAMEASRLKSEFLATMSHEIRTPMNGVIGLTELLLRTQLDDNQRRLASNLKGAGLTLLGIINDILDLSKIEAGRLELEAADFDVRAVFDQVASVLSGRAHDKGLELVVAVHPDVPSQLRGDQVRFGQILSNLGSNAVKFTDQGEVVIEAEVERQTPREVVLRVNVTDTGVGISSDASERLFDAFTQADPSTTRRHGGTGLGLAIARQLVEALGGEISVTSEPGRGSTFSFTATMGRAAEVTTPKPVANSELRGRRVLVVDDNETNRVVLEGQLTAWELRPVAVASAVEALATLREAARSAQPFEVMLVDMLMPDVDGLELARRVRADSTLVETRLLLLSSDHTVTRQQAAEVGIIARLDKPLRADELYVALRGLLGSPAEVGSAEPDAGTEQFGVRVLVVEDNPVNQIVAAGMLESFGCLVDIAADGVEAVELLSADHPYAVVLMDCRMPRLDGFDATRQVRRQEESGRVPIIAMTASALEGERERCLEAGMDDYLTKPVDAAELEVAIRRWAEPELPTGPAGSTAETTRHEDPNPGDGVLDQDRIRVLDDLVKDGQTFFERTAASFMGRVGGQLVAIREAIDAGSANALLTSSHQVKGSALNLGLPRVAQAAQLLEALGIAGRVEGAPALLDDLNAEVEAAVAALLRATADRH